ncbi:MAG: glycerol-3-phosphate 1-O-acyltransferase [Cytophagales bacterium]|nr:MAG: glycerol-3-phosphate 1-O-acyltransferase [Cytophagales bacterium]
METQFIVLRVLLYTSLGVLAYLIGSIPTAVWYGKAFHDVDVRTMGSMNAGATNTFRVLGPKAGSFVFLIDVFKGWTATTLANILYLDDVIWSYHVAEFKIIFGTLAVIGHIYPVFGNFKGGKGVATSLGLGLCMFPAVALVCLVLFFVILAISHYVSLGSIISTLAFPLLMFTQEFKPDDPLLIGFGFFAFALVIYTHRKNIKRLIDGNENKIYLIPQKKTD